MYFRNENQRAQLIAAIWWVERDLQQWRSTDVSIVKIEWLRGGASVQHVRIAWTELLLQSLILHWSCEQNARFLLWTAGVRVEQPKGYLRGWSNTGHNGQKHRENGWPALSGVIKMAMVTRRRKKHGQCCWELGRLLSQRLPHWTGRVPDLRGHI